jgi:hypothetical protein
MNLTTAVDRIAHLIPTYRSPNLVGKGVWVLTPPSELPEAFEPSQRMRNHEYRTTGSRTTPGYATRYLVTSYGVPIAWVSLDGRTHFLDDVQPHWSREVTDSPARVRAIGRHIDAVRAVWPDRFELDDDGEVSSRHAAPTAEEASAARRESIAARAN